MAAYHSFERLAVIRVTLDDSHAAPTFLSGILELIVDGYAAANAAPAVEKIAAAVAAERARAGTAARVDLDVLEHVLRVPLLPFLAFPDDQRAFAIADIALALFRLQYVQAKK